MKIVYATLEDGHSTSKLRDADIPEHSAVYVRVGKTLYNLVERDGALSVSVDGQIVVRPRVSNVIELRVDPR